MFRGTPMNAWTLMGCRVSFPNRSLLEDMNINVELYYIQNHIFGPWKIVAIFVWFYGMFALSCRGWFCKFSKYVLFMSLTSTCTLQVHLYFLPFDMMLIKLLLLLAYSTWINTALSFPIFLPLYINYQTWKLPSLLLSLA